MPLRTVTFFPDGFYHIYNRGSEKRTIFQEHRDYIKFLTRVKESAGKCSIEVLCYCLMTNHYHILAHQLSDISIAAFMNRVQLGHAKFFNTKYDRVGPLFQGRFKAKLIETDEYLLQLSAYIHRNPIADLPDSGNPSDSRNLLLDYPYSSYREYSDPLHKKLTHTDLILNYFSKTNPKMTYRAFVENDVTDYESLAPILADM